MQDVVDKDIMRRRQKILDPSQIPLAPGTRVVLQARHDDHQGYLKPGTVGQVVKAEGDQVTVCTTAGRNFTTSRSHLVVQKRRVLERAAQRLKGWQAFQERIIFATVVGSQAWGLSGPNSDQDVKGIFVWPFEDHAGFYDVTPEIHDPSQDGQYWEIEKFIHQALNADPNSLEALWSPLVVACSPLGRKLLEQRHIFRSQSIVGSFGRYALSQFKKIQKRLEKGDPGKIARPKNAYNLIRLLYSALSWIRTGEPLIEVQGAMREQLLAIKAAERPIEDVLAQGIELAAEVEDAHSQHDVLPKEPDYDAAHELLIDIRRAAALGRHHLFLKAPDLPAAIHPHPLKAAPRPDASNIDWLVFDLDDTLFDSYHQCVLPAHREAAEAMQKAGLKAELEQIAERRESLRASNSEKSLEEWVCESLQQPATKAICEAGQKAFFDRDPGAITPDAAAHSLLTELRPRRLSILTRGVDSTQQQKVDRLGLRALVDEVVIVPLDGSKAEALQALTEGADKDRVLVVGDNPKDEIDAAHTLKVHACWVAKGEFRSPPERAVWTIYSLEELRDWLKGL